MTQFDQDMWQEFVIEAEEHIHNIEPNLLLLEQHPEDMSIISDCFRSIHSIKGAAAYMGLHNINTLSHALEDLFDQLKNGETLCDTEFINIAFEAIDRLKCLVKEVAERQAEATSIDDILEKISVISQRKRQAASDRSVPPQKKSAFQDEGPVEANRTEKAGAASLEDNRPDDNELMDIYADEMKAIWSRLEAVMKDSDRVDISIILSILEDMARVTNYVGIDGLLNAIRRSSEEITSHEDNGLISTIDMQGPISRLAKAIEEVIGPITATAEKKTKPRSKIEEGEEDRELYEIFIDFVKEEAPVLASTPEKPDPEWVSACQSAIEKILRSANYMDYPEVVALMEEWSERLTEALTSHGSDKGFDHARLKEMWSRLVQLLPKLDDISDLSKVTIQQLEAGPAEIAKISALDNAIDSFFDEVAVGYSPDTLPSEPAAETRELTNDEHTHASDTEDDLACIPEHAIGAAADNQTNIAPAGYETNIERLSNAGGGSAAVFQAGADAISRPSKTSQTVRIDLERIDGLLSNVSELVILRSAFEQIVLNLKGICTDWTKRRLVGAKELKGLKDIMMRLSENTAALSRSVQQVQEDVMKIRMLPVGHLFERYPRVVRDLSQKLNKKVEMHILGGDTALDKRLIEQMADPLMHIIRNAVDHGIETPNERTIRLGKPPQGRIVLSASQDGNFVVIKVTDDGRGLNRDALIRKAASLGFIRPEVAQTLPDERVWEMIFLPGVTTATEVTETSGRGVGMDVVKKNVEKLGGTIKVLSVPNRGTEVTIRIPLTLAIIQALLVKVGSQVMAVPLSSVSEIVRVTSEEISPIEGYEVMSLRQETVPLIRLSRVFRGTGANENPQRLFVVVVRHGEFEAGLGVDSLLGQQDIVIKPLADFLTDEPGFSGATILGDGSIGLILDIPAVLNKAKGFIQRRQRAMELAAIGLGGQTNTIH
ncbi:MAG: chemotaxis protein CheW [Dissulfurimicrobium sp.]|uniref:chemotaxis protein CheW n=1 Tax=Dissulfurimicrobium sp. TaxID=2022436 RepID=UPI00404B35F9